MQVKVKVKVQSRLFLPHVTRVLVCVHHMLLLTNYHLSYEYIGMVAISYPFISCFVNGNNLCEIWIC